MPIARSLSALLAELKAQSGSKSQAFYEKATADLVSSNLLAAALRPGDAMPEFGLADGAGRIVTSRELLDRGPLVISFYRGAWCPFCATELDALQQALPEIEAAGGTLVAISPEGGGVAEATRVSRGLSYRVLMDMDHGLALAFGLLFRLTQEQQAFYRSNEVDLPLINGVDGWFLPVPATYVVGADGVITTAFVEPDPRERMEPDSIVAALRAIAAGDRSSRHATPGYAQAAGTLRSRR